MSNILRSRFFESSDLIRKNRVEHYLGSLPATEHDGDSLVADDLHDSDKPLASTLALIPIAAHQESRWIAPTMAEYAKQQTDEPFSVCLFLNAPLDQTNASTVDETVTAVEVAKRQHPQLDIRSSLEFIDEPTIGLVRRRLWNAALMLAGILVYLILFFISIKSTFGWTMVIYNSALMFLGTCFSLQIL